MSLTIASVSLGNTIRDVVIAGSMAFSLLLTIQAAYTLYLMIYTWDQPDARRMAQAPRRFRTPQKSFTVMLPARHEEEVIQSTIERVVSANYPLALLEVVVICSADDIGTIERAEEKIDELRQVGIDNVRVLTFNDKPINKPHGLNVGLARTRNELVTIFDAEDDIHPDIFNIVNTVMKSTPVAVLQCGVQLMNIESNWYSALNVLEYFFWFKSRLHFHARHRSIPLGGNTVFFTRQVLERVHGWDEHNLTEDADIGLRISVLGERVRVVYDDRYVTREETPPTLDHFIRQRTRWSQGFLQTLAKGEWKKLPTFQQRILAAYTLAFPAMQAMLGVYILIAIGMMFTFRTPVVVAMILDLPLYLLLAHLTLAIIGLYEFADAHHINPSWFTVVRMVLGYLPYQWVLAYASVRAAYRELQGINNWEKTQHVGAHRQAAAQSPLHEPIAS
jgi:glycosyltransferase XagB